MAIEGRHPPRAKARHWLAVVGLGTLGVGCGEAEPTDSPRVSRQAVAVADLPPSVTKAARKSLPGVDWREAWRNRGPAGETVSFELRGTTRQGKLQDIRVTETGSVLEVE